MNLHRIGMKVAGEGLGELNPRDLISVFHGWIQRGELEDLLIDVADYSHVYHGPGVVLVAHAGNYSVDDAGGKPGMAYYSKHEMAGDLGERLAQVCRHVLAACTLLEADEGLGRQVRFDAGDLEIFANDRLAAPNSDATMAAMQPVLDRVLKGIFAGNGWRLEREPDPAERFRLRVRSEIPVSAGDALQRLQE